ncbi:MAG: MFS transporter [Solobacterium sp.]|jgi:MFS family permease|nr:MFS transporter [Solobacterium sp.]MCH4206415.1 MFS transporter [Solobacterium sp.]MCH4227921.1 MFS transporter [Solobacterium sp.]MCH4283340.1 MFS transporter [Solobacterium sp.]
MKLLNEYRGLRKENYILFVGRIMTSFGSMIYPMLTMILSQKLHMTAGTIAAVMVIYSMTGIPMNLIGGKLADRCSKKNVIVLCSCITVLCYLICAFLPLSIYSMAIFALGSLISQMENPSYSALIADITPAKDRSRAYSLSYLGMNLGMVLAPTIGGLLFQDYLWLMFLIGGLTMIASTCLIYFAFDPSAAVHETASVYESADEHASVHSVLGQHRIILLFFAIMALDQAVYNQYGYLMPLGLGAVHGSEGAVIYGTLSSLNCVIVVIFTPLITRLFSRFNETQKLLIGDLLMVGSYFIFQLFLGVIPSYYAAITMFTWGEIFRTISSDPYLTKRIPQSHRGRLLSINSVAGAFAYGLASIAVGQIYDLYGSHSAWILVIALGCLTIALELWLCRADRRAYPDLYKKVDES